MNTKQRWIVFAITSIVAVVALSFVFAGCTVAGGEEPGAKDQGMNTSGEWLSSDQDFLAVVEVGHIELSLTDGETSSLYWRGSFPTTVKDGDKIVSKADATDREALDSSILGIMDDTKAFEIKDDRITFVFQIVGTKTTIKLSK